MLMKLDYEKTNYEEFFEKI